MALLRPCPSLPPHLARATEAHSRRRHHRCFLLLPLSILAVPEAPRHLEWSVKGRLGSIAPYIRELQLCEGMLAREWLRTSQHSRSSSNRCPTSGDSNQPLSLSEHCLGPASCGVEKRVAGACAGSSFLTELKLSCLMLDNLGDIKRMLSACKYLRVLEVDHVIFADESVEYLEEGGTSEVAPLDTLIIGPRTSTALISYLLHPLSTVR
ncbi:hypothetical protein BDZ97DRAFT_499670 [Flammula alnicola]|nr:hypothetical protein BDZ97DRAFT_499670 [Flammula alnicola]